MKLLLEIIEGDQAGARFRLRPGLVIGRKEADIILRDSKISGRHALIEENQDGRLVMRDNNSSNGLKVDGKRELEFVLEPGMIIQIGRTSVTILEDTEEMGADAIEIREPWASVLVRLTQRAMQVVKSVRSEVHPFQPPIRLDIVQGPQAGESRTFGYGPREVGSRCSDFMIKDPACPAQCFELVPHDRGALFKTRHPDVVLLNGRAQNSEYVVDGDEIEIRNIRIRVNLEIDD